MSTLKENMTADFMHFMNEAEFAEAATYYPADDPLTSYSLSVLYNNAFQAVDLADGSIASTEPHIHFEAAKLAVTPQPGDEVQVSGKRFVVTHAEPDSIGGVTVFLRNKEDC